MYDNLTERHEVYKVEQTNDVYCAVCGVPDRTTNHASKVANFTIQLMKNIDDFKMKDLAGAKIQVHCRVHTGAYLYIKLTKMTDTQQLQY